MQRIPAHACRRRTLAKHQAKGPSMAAAAVAAAQSLLSARMPARERIKHLSPSMRLLELCARRAQHMCDTDDAAPLLCDMLRAAHGAEWFVGYRRPSDDQDTMSLREDATAAAAAATTALLPLVMADSRLLEPGGAAADARALAAAAWAFDSVAGDTLTGPDALQRWQLPSDAESMEDVAEMCMFWVMATSCASRAPGQSHARGSACDLALRHAAAVAHLRDATCRVLPALPAAVALATDAATPERLRDAAEALAEAAARLYANMLACPGPWQEAALAHAAPVAAGLKRMLGSSDGGMLMNAVMAVAHAALEVGGV